MGVVDSLGSTQLPAAGLAQPKGPSKFSSLDLRYSRVTDLGLEHLRRPVQTLEASVPRPTS